MQQQYSVSIQATVDFEQLTNDLLGNEEAECSGITHSGATVKVFKLLLIYYRTIPAIHPAGAVAEDGEE